jgi:AmmeMemoRadiSam system protein B
MEVFKLRPAYVSGYFYPLREGDLLKFMSEVISDSPKKNVKGVVVPHAGYNFSGSIAGKVYSSIECPDTFVLIGPKHSMESDGIFLSQTSWATPIGEVMPDRDLGESLLHHCEFIHLNERIHANEHSLEVQVPFIKYVCPNAKILPIAVSTTSEGILSATGRCIANVIKQSDKSVVVVMSSDLNHHEPQEITLNKDEEVIKNLISLDPTGLLKTVYEEDVSMCGAWSCFLGLTILKELGVDKAELLEHRTSGDVNMDYNQVVGYAGILFE